MTEVVAALVWRGERFMICQRPAHKARGLLWEFVGGKTEPGETKEQALIRECREELDVEISVGEVFYDVVHEYPDLTVHLTLFSAEIAKGEPKLLEHEDIRWILPREIPLYAFCPADEEILEKILRERQEEVSRSVQKQLFALQDQAYGDFHSALMPTVQRERVIGIRMPHLRRFARGFAKTAEAQEFLEIFPHEYYEENNLHGLLIGSVKDFDLAMKLTEEFLPYVDNWATCDMLNPKVFAKHLPELLQRIYGWLTSDHVYTVRFGIGMLMRYFLEDSTFSPEYPAMVSKIRSDEYYVNMMISWYFATALAKQYDGVIGYPEQGKLSPWVHNKTIQKAVESYRITPERKEYLRTLRRK